MIYNSVTEYAMRGLAELASRNPEGPVLLRDLVAGTDLPRDYMAKIFQQLAKGGIVHSAKGRGGGFRLARPAHQITMLDVLESLGESKALSRCVIGLAACSDQMPCAQHDSYKPIRQRLNDYLATTTLADLAASLRSKAAWKTMNRKK